MSRRLEKLIEQKAWETLTDHGYNDAQLLEQLTESVLERLDEQIYKYDRPGQYGPNVAPYNIDDQGNPIDPELQAPIGYSKRRPTRPGRVESMHEGEHELDEQTGAPILPSWLGIVQFIQVQMAQADAGQGQDSYATSTYDYDGDGQITFSDLAIALSLWSRGIMPVNAQDYQAGALIVDDSGLGEPIPPEGEELLNVLTSGDQNSLGFNNPLDAIYDQFRNQTGAQTNVFNPMVPSPPPPPMFNNRNVSRTSGGSLGFAPQVPGYGPGDGLPGGYPVRPPRGPGMGGGPF